MFREGVTLYPINPKQSASYRDSDTNAGCKNDETDAWLLATMLRERIGSLRPWTPDDECTRKLARFSELRRNLVNEPGAMVSRAAGDHVPSASMC